ncbi:MAG: carbohydrate kinase family protein [Bacilli bacterium]|nr:carbohydrate kinase family protein [Bacilli bacterium]MDD3304908.1 carbohydrate kinase family protein [Bacilli bacterium]MDD4053492.1 carbohydrate kinase family protein [Bacilli bacterium]MDD4411527.1 carbohydrate kinase family protein [Bacilli bacterium]
MKILCIGHASYDITIPFDGYPLENTKNRVDEKYECGGGPASNAAYLLGKWGVDTTFVGVLGDDIYAKRIIDEFKSVGVNTQHIEYDKEAETTLSFIVVNKRSGSRTVIAHRNPEMELKEKCDLQADVILVDGQELKASIEAIDNNPKAISILDAGSLKESNVVLGKKVNYLVCSKTFAEDFTKTKVDFNNPTSVATIFSIMNKEFKNTIIITLESKGCLYMKDNKIKLMPSINVTPVDTTGAGDIFHGAFTYSIANNYDLEKALKISNITGALSVTRMGGRNSVFSLEEVMKIYEKNI